MTTTVNAVEQLKQLPNGSLVYYRRQPYFVSMGLDGRIVTNKNGDWTFIHELKWKTIQIVHVARPARRSHAHHNDRT